MAEETSEEPAGTEKHSDMFGSMSWEVTLDDFGGGSLFNGDYHSPYNDQFITLKNLDFFNRFNGGTYIDLSASHDFYTKSMGMIDVVDPGCWGFSISDMENRYLLLPALDEGKRRDTELDFVLGRMKKNTFEISYDDRNMRESAVDEGIFRTEWNSKDINISHEFDVSGWDTQVGVNRTDVTFGAADDPGTVHTSYSLTTEKEINEKALVSGDFLYNINEADTIGEVKNVRFGASGRIMDALGIDNLVMAAKMRWTDREDNVSLLHTAGDLFTAGLSARYKPSSKGKLNFSWNMKKATRSRPDRYAIDAVIDNPDLRVIDSGEIIEDTVVTNTCNLGGSLELSKDVDITADWKIIQRDGLDPTDFYVGNSPSLLWNSELIHKYVLRYMPRGKNSVGPGDFELKWTRHDRKNGARLSKSNDDHLTVNWGGNFTDRFNAYAGWGLFNTSTDIEALDALRQKGTEYGGGFDWYIDDHYLFYTDIWKYEVSGSDGFDRMDYLFGLRYSPGDDWKFNLEYKCSDDRFDEYSYIDGNLETLRLLVTYDW